MSDLEETRAATRRAIGADIRKFREAAGIAQQDVSAILGLTGRDAMSKAERGVNNITVTQYLEIMRYLRDFVPPDHPALALDQYFRRRVSRAK